MKTVVLCMLLQLSAWLLLVPAAFGRVPDNLPKIQHEAGIVADVLKSSLRSELRERIRVTSVTAQYLPMQGVLVTVDLNAPWLTINDGENSIQINGNLAIKEIPAMVENILADLQIDINTYEPDAVSQLRDLRAQQRDLRAQQRDTRSELREQRRALVRTDDAEERQHITREIERLEQALTDADGRYDQISADIDRQYEHLKDQRSGPTQAQTSFDDDWPALAARHACDYGGTLKSLRNDDYLTFALRRDDITLYFSYQMDHVKQCSEGDMRTARLAELAYHYSQ